MDACVQCRGCETACPSGVPFGRLMEGTRAALAADAPLHAPLAAPRLPGPRPPPSAAGRLHGPWPWPSGSTWCPGASGCPACRCGSARWRPTGTDVWLFTGCVMDAWQRDVHAAAIAVLAATGAGVALPGAGRRLLRRAPRPRRPDARRPRAWPSG